MVKYFWRGTEAELNRAGVRIDSVVEYLLDQQPVWIHRDPEDYWEKRFKLLKMIDSVNASDLYSSKLSGMRLPKKHLAIAERQSIIKYGKERLRREYGY